MKAVTVDDFGHEVPNTAGPAVVDLYADWCGPCRAVAPPLDPPAHAYAGRVKFVRVNLDDQPQLAGQFEVAGVPTLSAFDHGRPVHRSSGLPDPRGFAAPPDRLSGPRVTATP